MTTSNRYLLSALVLGLFAIPALASDPTITIQQVDPNFPAEKMAGPNVVVKKRIPNPPANDDLPKVTDRDTAFSKAGLRGELADWDQLDRDMLFMNASKSANAGDLKSRYPKLSSEKLKHLWKILHAGRHS